jgi:hypothetical protein
MFVHLTRPTRNKLHIKENLEHFAKNFAENFILKIEEEKNKPSFKCVLTDHRINRSFKKKFTLSKKGLKIINPNYH